jgi:uncharacterized protein YjbI with pentapeptide repeats
MILLFCFLITVFIIDAFRGLNQSDIGEIIGFSESTKVLIPPTPGTPTVYYRPAKTIWDFVELLFIPLALGLGAYFLNRSEKNREISVEEKRAALEREIMIGNQRHTALQAYFEKMTDLLIKENIRDLQKDVKVNNSKKTETGRRQLEALSAARAWTKTTLSYLNYNQKSIVIEFLLANDLIYTEKTLIDLSDEDLEGVTFHRRNLSKVRLCEAILTNAKFDGCWLNDADLTHTNLNGATFNKCKMYKTNLYETDASGARFLSTEMDEAVFACSNLADATFKNIDASSVNFAYAKAQKANFEGAKLQKANLEHIIATRASFKGANMQEANLFDADLTNSNFEDADLSNANIEGTNLEGTNFCGANLLGAKMSNTKIGNAKFDERTKLDRKWRLVHQIATGNYSNLDLTGVDLSGADLSNLNLEGINLSMANLRNTNFQYTNLRNANLFKADLRGGFFNRTDFEKANLVGALLDNACLVAANLLNAKVEHEQLEKVELDTATLTDGTLSPCDGLKYWHRVDE